MVGEEDDDIVGGDFVGGTVGDDVGETVGEVLLVTLKGTKWERNSG